MRNIHLSLTFFFAFRPQTRIYILMRYFIILCALFALGNFAQAGGKKPPKMSLTFHLESSPDPGKKLTFEANTLLGQKSFRRIPEIGTSHIEAYAPFPSPHNAAEFGLVLQLNRAGQTKLSTLTNQQRDANLLVFLNGRPIDILIINGPVKDGLICVWRGVSNNEIAAADAFLRRIGQTEKEWKASRKNKKK